MPRYIIHTRTIHKASSSSANSTWQHIRVLLVFIVLIATTHAVFSYFPSSSTLSSVSYRPRIVHIAKRSLDVAYNSSPLYAQNLSISEESPETENPPSYIQYYQLYDSIDSFSGRFFCLVVFILWMCFLFTSVGIVASDFFCPNLATLSGRLGLSEGVAGATVLAFGNGSPDVFSTFSAFTANSASLAIGELLGAATFIVAVVTGSMAIIQPFQVPRHSFVRDVGFFTVAIVFTLLILADHHITIWEAGLMVIMYSFYVFYVAFSTWWIEKRRRRQDLLSKVRREFEEDTPRTPYQDDPENNRIQPSFDQNLRPENSERGSTCSRQSNISDIPSLNEHEAEEAFRALTDIGTPITLKNEFLNDPNSTSLALPTSGHIIHPHSSSSRPVTRSQIRSSLLSAIEFRDVVNSLKDDSVARTLAVFGGPKNYHHHHHHHYRQSPHRHPNRPSLSHPSSDAFQMQSNRMRARTVSDSGSSTGNIRRHSRSLSDSDRETINHNDQASFLSAVDPPTESDQTFFLSAIEPPAEYSDRFLLHHDSNNDATGEELSPERDEHSRFATNFATSSNSVDSDLIDINPDKSHPPKLHVDTSISSHEHGSKDRSGKLSNNLPAIVVTTDNERTVNPLNDEHDAENLLEHPEDQTHAGSLLELTKGVLRMLFPSLQEQKTKSTVGRIASVMAVPTLLGLTLTLPVVLEDSADDCCESDIEKDSDDEEQRVEHTSNNLNESEEYHLNRQNGFQIARKLHDQASSPLHTSYMENYVPVEDNGRENSFNVKYPRNENCIRVDQALNFIQCTLAVPFILIAGQGDSLRWWYILVALASGVVVACLSHYLLQKNDHSGRIFLCVVGFIVSAVWIMMLVNEVVGVLLAVGKIFHISDAILGVTIFAVGNSMGDLISNITVARMGFPVMAFSACFAGPMLNILFGVGVSGLYSILSRGGKSFEVEMNGTLFVSGIGLLVLLASTLIIVPMRKHWITRGWGMTLIAMYSIMMAINITVEMSGS